MDEGEEGKESKRILKTQIRSIAVVEPIRSERDTTCIARNTDETIVCSSNTSVSKVVYPIERTVLEKEGSEVSFAPTRPPPSLSLSRAPETIRSISYPPLVHLLTDYMYADW